MTPNQKNTNNPDVDPLFNKIFSRKRDHQKHAERGRRSLIVAFVISMITVGLVASSVLDRTAIVNFINNQPAKVASQSKNVGQSYNYHYLKALYYISEYRFMDALEHIKKLNMLNNKSSGQVGALHFVKSFYYSKTGEYDLAVGYIDLAISNFEDRPANIENCLLLKSEIFIKQGNIAVAEKILRETEFSGVNQDHALLLLLEASDCRDDAIVQELLERGGDKRMTAIIHVLASLNHYRNGYYHRSKELLQVAESIIYEERFLETRFYFLLTRFEMDADESLNTSELEKEITTSRAFVDPYYQTKFKLLKEKYQ